MATKTATVRDLRNSYTTLLKWIEAGEEIFITRKGKVFARLVPEKNDSSQKKVDWTKSSALKLNHAGEKVISAQESAMMLQASQGKW